MFARRLCLAAVIASVCAFTGTAHATPTFLSAINISDAGQDAFEPQVVTDSAGNVHAVWTRSDGTHFRIQYATRTPGGPWSVPINISDATQSASQPQIDVDPSNNLLAVWTRSDGANLRIQAAFKPSGGSWGAGANISDPGFDANEPQIDFDATGKAIAVWSRFDGSKLRIQASIRTAGTGGSFLSEVTLSEPGQDAFDAQIDSGPNVETNAVVVWTRSDGAKLRVQSARRRDVTGFPRPKSAGSLRLGLAPAFNQCNAVSANRVHGPPLTHPSCTPPVRSSSVLTVGTPDANGQPAQSASFMRIKGIAGNTATEANEADVSLITQVTDVRNHPANTDYVGNILMRVNVKITDMRNAAEMPEPGTVKTFPLSWPVSCVATGPTTQGSNCIATSSLNALYPGAMVEGRRSLWEVGQGTVLDAGPNGTGLANCPPTCGDGDETVFMRQAIFLP